jgi:hypothetical protein
MRDSVRIAIDADVPLGAQAPNGFLGFIVSTPYTTVCLKLLAADILRGLEDSA